MNVGTIFLFADLTRGLVVQENEHTITVQSIDDCGLFKTWFYKVKEKEYLYKFIIVTDILCE